MSWISRRLAVLTLPLAIPGALRAQAVFEGRITAEMSGRPNQPGTEVVILSKGSKSRMDMNAGGMEMYMIMDGEAGAMLSVVPAQRMYMRMDLKAAAQSMGGMGRSGTAAPPQITRTGRHETIAGRDCEHVTMASERGEMDICAAKGMGFFMGPGGGIGGRGAPGGGIPAGYEQLVTEFKDGFFPLRIELVEGDKRTQFLLVKKIEPQSLEASLFEPPAGFQEMKMPAMPGMGRP